MVQSTLIDNSILSHGKFGYPISIALPNWGNRLALIQAKPALPPDQHWLRTQIEALPTIARLAREKTLALHSYFELEMEEWRGGNFPALILGDVFSNVEIARVSAPLDRSFFQTDMKDFVGADAQIQFCQFLLNDSSKILKAPKILARLTASQISNLKEAKRYREICRSLSPKQYVDALHVWTGELNGIETFLTTDATLVRALSSNKKLLLRCKPIFPEALLVEMGIANREPLPFEYGRRYSLNGLPHE
ncbi:hypothetical protein SAMN05216374_4626 [Tardiphaga sp. OK246]|jgi:hypothetical protein|nr:hypothetical protein SAMN05216374_4626 [Tardiphaga sp. OK246]